MVIKRSVSRRYAQAEDSGAKMHYLMSFEKLWLRQPSELSRDVAQEAVHLGAQIGGSLFNGGRRGQDDFDRLA